ncbi:AbiJ-NTD4 domain-containing protein [Sulfitobacter sp. SK011]|uniref:AbiJ-NTD4 domain-containing protein n=1 Tax=Sulfitobacter sp. SK011 TaxID=1389004 RepID=UPI0013B42B99|nr:hypothetical protein [Sulfitobacter sp. SK011]
MLTDIFAVRYESRKLFSEYGRREQRTLHQCMTCLEELSSKRNPDDGTLSVDMNFWNAVHGRVSNELGMRWLSDPYQDALGRTSAIDSLGVRERSKFEISRDWMERLPSNLDDTDEFLKNRISLIEVGFREAYKKEESQIRFAETNPKMAEFLGKNTKTHSTLYNMSANELNKRFRDARFPLHYHNGFVQIEADKLISTEIEQPFWSLVSEPLWENVDLDMKEALDQRDSGGKDPALYAAKALESTIKIISSELNITHGKENGAHNFIENIGKKDVGFIRSWEADFLKSYFTKVRNPLGHGPGKEEMPRLTAEQTNWAIESAMSWIKLLVQRYTLLPERVQ